MNISDIFICILTLLAVKCAFGGPEEEINYADDDDWAHSPVNPASVNYQGR
jgi:hypothetical protein